MHAVEDSVKRSYRSELRSEQALRTRRAIRDAARTLFLTDGYAATTVRQVAAAAGVGERTLYDAFPTKLALFREVLGVATAGDEMPLALRERPDHAQRVNEGDAGAVIVSLAARTTEIMERAGALMMVVIESSGADPDMREVQRDSLVAMRRNMGDVARSMRRRGTLRAGVSAAEATDVLVTMLSPHTYNMLRVRFGWSAARYRSWIAARLKDALLPEA